MCVHNFIFKLDAYLNNCSENKSNRLKLQMIASLQVSKLLRNLLSLPGGSSCSLYTSWINSSPASIYAELNFTQAKARGV